MNQREQRRRTGLVHERAGGPTEWYTPPRIFAALGLSFDLDPCSAQTHYTRSENGLAQPWHGRVWLNPPYGRGIGCWLERFAMHRDGIALVFARTDTEWFHRYACQSDAVCFTRGRIPFLSPAVSTPARGGPGCGSLLLAHGIPCVDSLRQSGLGFVIDLGGQREGRQQASRRPSGRVTRGPSRKVEKAARSPS
jgi:hypothetical protein